MAWLLLFGVSAKADQAALGGALKQLLERLCCELLWTGPECCCDPHGVVIGCVVVEGGTIQHIDPFGGRRWVIHYPLLAHYAARSSASRRSTSRCRVSSRSCVASAHWRRPPSPRTLRPGSAFPSAMASFTSAIWHARWTRSAPLIVSQRKVGLAEMIASVLTLMTQRPSAARPQPAERPASVRRAAGETFHRSGARRSGSRGHRHAAGAEVVVIEDRVGEVRLRIRTDLSERADIRPAAEEMVCRALERCAAILEARVPGRVVLIRRLPLHLRADESMLDDAIDVEDLARAAADAIEHAAVPFAFDRSAADAGGVMFEDEAQMRARTCWRLRVVSRNGSTPCSILPRPATRSPPWRCRPGGRWRTRRLSTWRGPMCLSTRLRRSHQRRWRFSPHRSASTRCLSRRPSASPATR